MLNPQCSMTLEAPKLPLLGEGWEDPEPLNQNDKLIMKSAMKPQHPQIPNTPTLSPSDPSDGERGMLLRRPGDSPCGEFRQCSQFSSLAPSDGERGRVRGRGDPVKLV